MQKELNPIYYASDDWHIKNKFTEKQYEKYLNFGIRIGNMTLDILKEKTNCRNIEIFKYRMNFIDNQDNTLEYIGKKYNITRERIRQIINKLTKILLQERKRYIKTLNKISKKDIINYLIIGILNLYNIWFLKCLLSIVAKNECNKIIDNIFQKIENLKQLDALNKYKEIEKQIYKSIVFPKNKNPYSTEIFNKLHIKRKTFIQNQNGIKIIEQLNTEVDYESETERKIIGRFSNLSFVKAIKTQSLIINYKYKNKYYQYYPDIQILTKDNYLVIIEVKPLYRMLTQKVLIKYEALKSFCKKNGFGYLMIDEKNNAFENIRKTKVNEQIENEFMKVLFESESMSYDEFKLFEYRYNLTHNQIIKIILNNIKNIEITVKPFNIKYRKIF